MVPVPSNTLGPETMYSLNKIFLSWSSMYRYWHVHNTMTCFWSGYFNGLTQLWQLQGEQNRKGEIVEWSQMALFVANAPHPIISQVSAPIIHLKCLCLFCISLSSIYEIYFLSARVFTRFFYCVIYL